MADSFTRYDNLDTRPDGPNLDVAMDQHDRARQATDSNGINWIPVSAKSPGQSILSMTLAMPRAVRASR